MEKEPNMLNQEKTALIQAAEQYDLACQQRTAALEKARTQYEDHVKQYEKADMEIIHSAATITELEDQYHRVATELQSLLIDEDRSQKSRQKAISLTEEIKSQDTSGENTYHQLLRQALDALLTVTNTTEEEVEVKRQRRLEKESDMFALQASCAAARLRVNFALLQRGKQEEECVNAGYQVIVEDTAQKITRLRKTLLEQYRIIAQDREELTDILNQHLTLMDETQQLASEEQQRQETIQTLTSELETPASRISAAEEKVAELLNTKKSLNKQADSAAEAIKNAKEQENEAAQQLQNLNQEEQELTTVGESQLTQMKQANQERLAQKEADINQQRECITQLANDISRMEKEVEAAASALAELQAQKQEAELARDKARITLTETEHMMENIRSARSSMKSEATSVLSNAEQVLQNTMENAQAALTEKEQIWQELSVQDNLSENDFSAQKAEFQQLKDRYEQESALLQREEEEWRNLSRETEEEEKQQDQNHALALTVCKQKKELAELTLEKSKNTVQEKIQLKEEADKHLAEIEQRYQQAVTERDQVKERISILQRQIEEEKLKLNTALKFQITNACEKDNVLHRKAKELGNHIKKEIEATYKLQNTEDNLRNLLAALGPKTAEKLQTIQERNQQQLTGQLSLEEALKQAKAYYKEHLQNHQQLTADKHLLTESEVLLDKAATLRKEMENSLPLPTLDITQPELPAFALLTDPIPQIQGDEEITLPKQTEKTDPVDEAEIDNLLNLLFPEKMDDYQILSHSNFQNKEEALPNVDQLQLIDTSALLDLDQLIAMQQFTDLGLRDASVAQTFDHFPSAEEVQNAAATVETELQNVVEAAKATLAAEPTEENISPLPNTITETAESILAGMEEEHMILDPSLLGADSLDYSFLLDDSSFFSSEEAEEEEETEVQVAEVLPEAEEEEETEVQVAEVLPETEEEEETEVQAAEVLPEAEEEEEEETEVQVAEVLPETEEEEETEVQVAEVLPEAEEEEETEVQVAEVLPEAEEEEEAKLDTIAQEIARISEIAGTQQQQLAEVISMEAIGFPEEPTLAPFDLAETLPIEDDEESLEELDSPSPEEQEELAEEALEDEAIEEALEEEAIEDEAIEEETLEEEIAEEIAQEEASTAPTDNRASEAELYSMLAANAVQQTQEAREKIEAQRKSVELETDLLHSQKEAERLAMDIDMLRDVLDGNDLSCLEKLSKAWQEQSQAPEPTAEEEAAELERIRAAEEARRAAEEEAARIQAEKEAARRAAEEEAARLLAEEEAALLAAEQEAARIQAEEEAAQRAAEEEAALAEEQARQTQQAETARLAAIAQAAEEQLSADVSTNEAPQAEADDEEEDSDLSLQAELRRLIFKK